MRGDLLALGAIALLTGVAEATRRGSRGRRLEAGEDLPITVNWSGTFQCNIDEEGTIGLDYPTHFTRFPSDEELESHALNTVEDSIDLSLLAEACGEHGSLKVDEVMVNREYEIRPTIAGEVAYVRNDDVFHAR